MTNEAYEGKVVHTFIERCEDCGGTVHCTVTEDDRMVIREYHACTRCGYDVLVGETEPEPLDVYAEMEVA